MRIRNTSKAVILRDGHVLLQRCRTLEGSEFYELPGGGQEAGETMEEVVIRECLEETGYAVRVDRFLALTEEITDNEALIKQYPDCAHRMFHIFLCHIIEDAERVEPTEVDTWQTGMEWHPVEAIGSMVFRPESLRGKLPALLKSDAAAYLGSKRIDRIDC